MLNEKDRETVLQRLRDADSCAHLACGVCRAARGKLSINPTTVGDCFDLAKREAKELCGKK